MACGRNALRINQREVILIPFPFSDLSGTKVRPALVISNDEYNTKNHDVIVLAVTSNLLPNSYKVFFDLNDLDFGFIPVKSAIRVDKPFSFLQTKTLKVLGTITTEKLQQVKTTLQNIL